MRLNCESNRASKAEYVSRINRVVDYIKANLDGDLSLEQLAKVALFSKFYFHRIFKSIMDENLNAFVTRMRIERSAFALLHNPKSAITSIAYESGFSSPAVFSREFKTHYLMSPTEWRKNKKSDKNNSDQLNSKIHQANSNHSEVLNTVTLYIDDSTKQARWRINMHHEKEFHIDVRNMPEICIAYIRHHGYYDPRDKKLFGALYARLMAWAIPRNLFNPPQTKALTVFSSGYPETTEPEKLSVDVCISIEKNTPVDGEVGKRVIAAGQYAVVSLREVAMEEASAAWDAMFNRWLPNSGYQPGEGAYYINHQNDPEQHPKKLYDLEMYLPVKPL